MSLINNSVSNLPKPNYKYITNEEDAGRAIEEILKHPRIPIDTEVTDLDPYLAKLSLVQMGTPNFAYVFDVRHDTEHSSLHVSKLDPVLNNNSILKVLQNAVFDMKVLKLARGYYLRSIYDTMLVEQLLNLGLIGRKADLASLVFKYLGLIMNKEPSETFVDYNQKFQPYQLEYAANDVLVLNEIMDAQLSQIKEHGFEDVCRLEFEFTIPMCEMELNGVLIDSDMWTDMMSYIAEDRDAIHVKLSDFMNSKEDQVTLFDTPVVNLDSPIQLKRALAKCGINVKDTNVGTLSNFKDVPFIKDLLDYRKAQKLVSTYGQALLDRINPITGRLHTRFKQMVSTGRMSSSDPNLQNIPKKQKYRSGFVAKEGYVLVKADMSGAELRILGNVSADPIFVDSYARGIDLHTRTASEMFDVHMDKVDSSMRNAAKAVNFGLCYGLTKYGLSRRLEISEDEAQDMINRYFVRYKGVKNYLDKSGRDGVRKRYSSTISGRKRFYNLPPVSDPDYKRQAMSVERQSKNAAIQGANADTIKQSMVYLVDRLEKSGYDAKLILTVHDEVVIECLKEQRYEVADLVCKSLIDGFGRYFSLIPMETDALIGDCWLKDACEAKTADGKKCGHNEMYFKNTDGKRKLVCDKCGSAI